MNRKRRRNLVSFMWPGVRHKSSPQTQIRVAEGRVDVTHEKDRYIFSSVYPNEAVMNRVEAILRDNHKKTYRQGRIILSEE